MGYRRGSVKPVPFDLREAHVTTEGPRMADHKQIVAVPLEVQLSTARTEGTPLPRFKFGPDDPRIDLI